MKKKLNPNARMWVRALRSGKFKQAKVALCRIRKERGKEVKRFCCLGVACEVFIKSGGVISKELGEGRGTDRVEYGGSVLFLPEKVRAWLGLRDTGGEMGEMGDDRSLATLNDKGTRFSTIANLIESQPEGLFVE